MSQSHLALGFPLKSPDDTKVLPNILSPMMLELFKAEDAIGSVHYSRFTVLSGKTFLFLADFDGEFSDLMLDLASVSGDEAEAPQMTTAQNWHVGFEPGPTDNPAEGSRYGQAPFHTVARLTLVPKSQLTREASEAVYFDVTGNSMPDSTPLGSINQSRSLAGGGRERKGVLADRQPQRVASIAS